MWASIAVKCNGVQGPLNMKLDAFMGNHFAEKAAIHSLESFI